MSTDAPRSRQRSNLYCEPAVTATDAPRARATWIACVPIPLPPPCISSNCPECRFAPITRFDHTVHATSGSAAAACTSRPSGTGSTCDAGTTTCSA